MRFRVLGRLRVEPQTPSAAKMCTVLCTLLVGANEVVSSDSLIDELWGDDPPRTATTTLHVYISHLRKLLADDSDGGRRDRIETRLPGYLIRTSPHELDLHQFEALCAQGQEAYARRDFAGSGRVLREALGLWTGPVLSGVPRGRRLQAAADRLELLRLDAGEQRIAAELWLGRHRQLIGELTVLAREHPLRETLHAHLIVALYRSHRQSEALSAYDTIRRSLARELGTDPGTALRELHQRVLRSEPIVHFEQCQGDREAVVVNAPPAPVVRLPRTVHELIGRQDELEAAQELLRASSKAPATRVVNIVGAAGSGKTAFSAELAHRSAALFPDGRVFVGLRGSDGRPLDARGAMLRLLRLLRPGPDAPQPGAHTDADELGDLLHVALAGRRMLLVLDDADSGAQVRAIAAAASAGTVLITSRKDAATLHGSRTLTLDVLGPRDSVELLATAARRPLADDPRAADIARLCGHLPLALHAAGAVLAARPHWAAGKLAARLREKGSRLDVLALGDHEVRARLLAGLADLAPEVQRAFRLLVLAPGSGFASWSAAALLGVSQLRAEQLVEQLVRAGLLHTRSAVGRPVRYAYDELFRAVAGELLAEEDPERIRDATRRLCAGYLELARYAQARMAPDRSWARAADEDATPLRGIPEPEWFAPEHPVGDTPLRWFQEESQALAEAVRQAHTAGCRPLVWHLAEAVTGYFEVSGEWELWESTAELALDAVRRDGERDTEAWILCSLGDLAWQRGQFDLARTRYELAGRRAREATDGRIEARVLTGLADAESGLGRPAEARRLYVKASLLCRTAGDLRGLSDALRGLALTELLAGEPRAALRSFAECRDAAHQLGDQRWSEYARRAQDGIRLNLSADRRFDDEPLELRPGVWAMGQPGGPAPREESFSPPGRYPAGSRPIPLLGDEGQGER